MVIHGTDGLDEISLTAPTLAAELKDGTITEYELDIKDFGFEYCSLEDLKGGTPKVNADIIRSILDGDKGPKRDIAVINAGAALYVSGIASDLKAGIAKAGESIDSGAAKTTLEKFISFSQ